MGSGVKAHAICAVPNDVDTPCEELLQSLHDAIDEAKFPDEVQTGDHARSAHSLLWISYPRHRLRRHQLLERHRDAVAWFAEHYLKD